MEFVDSHCHPHFDDFLPDAGQMLTRAEQAGVKRLIAVGTTLEDSQKAIDFAAGHKNVWASAGVHPHDASQFLSSSDNLEKLKQILNSSSIVAVGEIGLDYYKNYSPKEEQLKCLKQQIEIGLPTGLPFIFHVRDAWDDFWPLIDNYPGIKGVIHSFSSDQNQLHNVLKRGLFVGLNGIMTFTSDEAQLKAAKTVPLTSLLLETDAPFLAPKPFRGQICEPKHVRTVAEFLAHLRGQKLEELANTTTANALNLFKLDDNG